MTTQTEAVRYSPYDYEIHEDPYPTYARLRAEAPLYRNEEFDFWALSRYDDVVKAFRDVERFSNRFGVSLDPTSLSPDAHHWMSLLAMDPPRHTQMRTLVGKGFSPRRVAELEPQIRALAQRYLEPALDGERFDFIADFAGKLPMDVISQMVGVPESDRVEVRRLADLVLHREEGLFDVPQAGLDAALTLAAYYAEMVRDRRKQQRDDLTSALLEAEIDGQRLSDDEIVAFLFLLVVAGNETTTKLLGNCWYWAWRNPREKKKAFSAPDTVPAWVEETLRYDASTQMLLRVVNAETTLLGQPVAEGDKLLLLIGSANRDEAVFDDAEHYDLDRDTTKLMSFGSGRHFCMGAALARLEARIALGELTARVLDYDIDPEGIERVHSVNVRGFSGLPTTVRAR